MYLIWGQAQDDYLSLAGDVRSLICTDIATDAGYFG